MIRVARAARRLRDRIGVGVDGAPGHDGELRLPGHLDPRRPTDPLVQELRQVELLVERLPEHPQPVELQGKPYPEAPEVPRELRRVVGEVARLPLPGQVLQVLRRPRRVRLEQAAAVTDQETAGAVGEEHPLVRVERDRVGSLETGKRGDVAVFRLDSLTIAPQCTVF
jgi:hypothetical protein